MEYKDAILWREKAVWEVLDTGVNEAEENMRIDAELLLVERASPLLHFYDWKGPSATYGHFVNPGDYLNLAEVERSKLTLARRPTGGGILFHQWDFAFSLFVPAQSRFFSLNTLENYAFVNNVVLKAVQSFLKEGKEMSLTPVDEKALDRYSERFCMARPTKYDVVLGGRKIAGAAQRRNKMGFLHQGSIALALPPYEELKELLLPDSLVWEGMARFALPLLGKEAKEKEIKWARGQLRSQLIHHFREER
jgi:lipoate---protein ligase